MDRSDTINLISETYTTDSIGRRIPVETSRMVFCSIGSITQSEFFEAGQSGISPEYRVTMNDTEYNGEKIAELNSVRYGIYRTFRRKNELIELYLERKVGV